MFHSKFIAQALGIPAGPEGEFNSIQTDSRKVVPGSLFVALPGDVFDGHDFIEAAIGRGAAGVLCRTEHHVLPRPGLQIFRVENTLAAYTRLGAAWRARFSIPVIGVAGSVGKTTTKELLASMLGGRFSSVLKTQGSQNGFIGIPMTLLELRTAHQAAVIEIGIDEIGAMVQHLDTVRPGFSVVTAIGPEHLEKLVDLRTVAREEILALTYVFDQGGTVILNVGDEWIRPVAGNFVGTHALAFQLLRQGEKLAPSPQLIQGQASENGSELRCSGPGFSNETFELPLLGAHNASNFLAAFAVARAVELTPAEIREGLRSFKPATGRSNLVELPGPTPVLCDYYNANPSSMEAGLELLKEIGKTRLRFACLGDMLELGPNEELFHRELAPKIISAKVDHLLLFGPRMRALAQELRSSEFQGTVQHFEDQDMLADTLVQKVKPGDAILIKGSRGMKMENVWARLEQHSRGRWSTSH